MTKKVKKCIIIPMRGGSKGIPRKNLALFKGKPLLHYVISAAVLSDVNDIFVSTDDEEIKNESLKYPRVTVLDRDAHLAADNSTDFVVFEDFLKKHSEYDYIIHLRATYPKITSKIINDAVKYFERNEVYTYASSMRSVVKAKEVPWKMWFINKPSAQPEWLAPAIKPEISITEKHLIEHYSHPRQSLKQAFYQNAAIDIIKCKTITEARSTVGSYTVPFVMDDMVENGIDIDEIGDLE